MNHAIDRRQFFRSSFHAPVQLHLAGRQVPAQLLDISLKGALLELREEGAVQAGEACQLRLALAPDAFILMDGVIAYCRGHQVGLRGEHLDVDSMTHLRQVLEHNVEDPAVWARDLGMLARNSRAARAGANAPL